MSPGAVSEADASDFRPAVLTRSLLARAAIPRKGVVDSASATQHKGAFPLVSLEPHLRETLFWNSFLLDGGVRSA